MPKINQKNVPPVRFVHLPSDLHCTLGIEKVFILKYSVHFTSQVSLYLVPVQLYSSTKGTWNEKLKQSYCKDVLARTQAGERQPNNFTQITGILTTYARHMKNIENAIVWFQKISIPPPRRELKIPKGKGGQRPRKFQREGGLYDLFSFQRSFDSIRIWVSI